MKGERLCACVEYLPETETALDSRSGQLNFATQKKEASHSTKRLLISTLNSLLGNFRFPDQPFFPYDCL